MAKRVRKKTKAELADPTFRRRASSQSEVLMRACAECDKLSKSRRQYIPDVADDAWMSRFENKDDNAAFEKECRRWAKLRREFAGSVSKPLEIHCFTCSYNACRGMRDQNPRQETFKDKGESGGLLSGPGSCAADALHTGSELTGNAADLLVGFPELLALVQAWPGMTERERNAVLRVAAPAVGP